jgi:hypothetical protein
MPRKPNDRHSPVSLSVRQISHFCNAANPDFDIFCGTIETHQRQSRITKTENVDEVVLSIMRTIRFLFSRAVIIGSAGYLAAILRRINYTPCYRVFDKCTDEKRTFDKVEEFTEFGLLFNLRANCNFCSWSHRICILVFLGLYNDVLSTAGFNKVGWL